MARPGIRRAASGVTSASASLLGAGAGGIPELSASLTDDSVAWALLRWEVGSGTFVRSKLVAIHFNGEEVPVVRRGRLNARSAEVLSLLGEAHATIEVKRKEDLHVDYVCERLMKVLTSDSMAKSLSAEALRKDYEARIEKQKSEKGKDKGPRGPRTVKDHPGKQITVDRALAAVGDSSGPYNWALLEPDRLELHNAGYGGLTEMKEWLAEDMVLFGMVRFTFGRDTVASTMEGMTAAPKVVKYIFIHWVGPKVSAVRRGKWNAQQKKADEKVRTVCSITFRREAHALEELELSDLISELLRLAVVDGAVSDSGKSQISVEEYMASLALEQQRQIEAEMEELGEQEAEGELPEMGAAVSSVRTAGGDYNWVLLGMQKPPAAAQDKNSKSPLAGISEEQPTKASADEKDEQEKLAKEAADAKKAEEEKLAKDAADAKKAEEEKLAKEAADAKKAEEEKLAKEAADAKKKAEEEKLAKEAADAKKAEEEKLAKEAADAKKAQEGKLAKEAADAKKASKKDDDDRMVKTSAQQEASMSHPLRSPTAQPERGYPRRASQPAVSSSEADVRPEASVVSTPSKSSRSDKTSEAAGKAEPRLRGMMKLKSGWGWWWARRHVELRAGKLQWWRKAPLPGEEPQGQPDEELRLSDGITRWVLMRREGTVMELICESRSGSTSKAMGERVLLRADNEAKAQEWAEALREQMEYVETLLAWPMPLEGRQGDVRYYGIEYPN